MNEQGCPRYVVAFTMEVRMDRPPPLPRPIPHPPHLRRRLHPILHPLHLGPNPRRPRMATSLQYVHSCPTPHG